MVRRHELTDAQWQKIEPDRDGDASCPLHEAAALITDNAGQRLTWAARSLDPQGGDVE